MPIYEYRCAACGHRFEKLVRCACSEEALQCPQCGAKSPERLISAFGIGGSTAGSSAGGSGCVPVGGG
jgi:putative FmdB family regulatory protein